MNNAQILETPQNHKSGYVEVDKTLDNYKNSPQIANSISRDVYDMINSGLSKNHIESYAKRARSPKVLEMLNQFSYSESAKSKIWEKFSKVLMHLDSENVKNQKLINSICETLSRPGLDFEEAVVALELIDKSCNAFRKCDQINGKIIMHLLDIINFNEDHRSIYPINIDMLELIEPKLFKFIEEHDQNSFTKTQFLDSVLSYLGVHYPDLLTEREKERLLMPQQTRIEDSQTKQLKRFSIGEYVSKNAQNINEFLEMRKRKIPQSASDKSEIINILHSSVKTSDPSNKAELLGMFTFGINGSKDQEKQVKYRKMLQEKFTGIDSGRAFEKWKLVKNDMLKPLVEACKSLDVDKQPSIDAVLSIFKQGIGKLSEDDAKELQQIYEKLAAMLGEEHGKKIIAYTIQGKDNIINIEAGRIRACTFIDNPIGSYAMFNYSIDPSIVLINYSILKDQHVNHYELDAMPVYGMAICAIGKFHSGQKSGTMLFVDSVEGGIDFRDAAIGMEIAITESIVKKAAEIGVSHVGFYTNTFPDTYSKLFVDSIEGPEEEIANISLEITRDQYLDSLRREHSNEDKSIRVPVKIIQVKMDMQELLRT